MLVFLVPVLSYPYSSISAGPLQLSLDKMILDTLRFLVLFSVTFFAFGISMTQLYWAYGKVSQSSKLDPVF